MNPLDTLIYENAKALHLLKGFFMSPVVGWDAEAIELKNQTAELFRTKIRKNPFYRRARVATSDSMAQVLQETAAIKVSCPKCGWSRPVYRDEEPVNPLSKVPGCKNCGKSMVPTIVVEVIKWEDQNNK